MFAHFNHSQLRKYILAFGKLFGNVVVSRTANHDGTGAEKQQFKVPIEYGAKERWFVRLTQDPHVKQGVRVVVPRMGYDLKNISYDSSRHLNTMDALTFPSNEARMLARIYVGVPYKLSFELSILTKLQSDGMQIVEQILPYFTPDLTFTLNVLPDLGLLDVIPVVLTGVNYADLYEGDFEKNRLIQWNLTFDMNVNFYGLRRKQSRIEEVIVDIYSGVDDLTDAPTFIGEESESGHLVSEDGLSSLVNEATPDAYLSTGRVVRVDVVPQGDPTAPDLPDTITTTVTEDDGDVIRTRVGTDETL